MKISIITAVLNRHHTIKESIQSVQYQTWSNFEHIIQDGGSTDGTLDIARRLADRRTQIISEHDNGIYDAINRGILKSSGDIIGLMHSDDTFSHNKILEYVANAFTNPNIDGVYGDLDYISTKDPNRIIRHWKAGIYHTEYLKRGWMPPHPTLYLRRRVFDKWGLYDTSFRISADYDAILRYLVKGKIKLAYIPDVMVKMKIGGESNRSLGRIICKSREDLIAIRRNNVGGLLTLLLKNILKIHQFSNFF